MVKKLALIAVVISIYGCGGESKSEDPPPVVAEKLYINDIEVPPEPDGNINNSTVKGIDIDNNGIRDDIDRVLAVKFGLDKGKYEVAKEESYLLQKAIINQDEKSISDYDKFLNCVGDDAPLIEISDVNIALLNTVERKAAYLNAFQGTVNVVGEECGDE